MTDPLGLAGTTPRYALPLLFAGQVQKELTVNEALQRAEFLLACTIEAVVSSPPATPAEGDAWLVGTAPTGAFVGHESEIAGWTANGWRFVSPREGLRVYDRAVAAFRLFNGAWILASAPTLPTGGTMIDPRRVPRSHRLWLRYAPPECSIRTLAGAASACLKLLTYCVFQATVPPVFICKSPGWEPIKLGCIVRNMRDATTGNCHANAADAWFIGNSQDACPLAHHIPSR